MIQNLEKACEILSAGNYTCAACCGDISYTATDRGVAPLMNWLDSGIDLRGFSAADRVVGRATAFLYVLLGVKAVSARVMSKPAAEVLSSYGIFTRADKMVDGIINRKGDGPCPFESAVMGITDAQQALAAIREKRAQMRKESN